MVGPDRIAVIAEVEAETGVEGAASVDVGDDEIHLIEPDRGHDGHRTAHGRGVPRRASISLRSRHRAAVSRSMRNVRRRRRRPTAAAEAADAATAAAQAVAEIGAVGVGRRDGLGVVGQHDALSGREPGEHLGVGVAHHPDLDELTGEGALLEFET